MEKEFIRGFADAQKLVGALRLEVYGEEGESFAWNKLRRIGNYLSKQQIAMGAAYYDAERSAAA